MSKENYVKRHLQDMAEEVVYAVKNGNSESINSIIDRYDRLVRIQMCQKSGEVIPMEKFLELLKENGSQFRDGVLRYIDEKGSKAGDWAFPVYHMAIEYKDKYPYVLWVK